MTNDPEDLLIAECFKMSEGELIGFLQNCFNKLESDRFLFEAPSNKNRTYNILLKNLKKRLNKLTNKSKLNLDRLEAELNEYPYSFKEAEKKYLEEEEKLESLQKEIKNIFGSFKAKSLDLRRNEEILALVRKSISERQNKPTKKLSQFTNYGLLISRSLIGNWTQIYEALKKGGYGLEVSKNKNKIERNITKILLSNLDEDKIVGSLNNLQNEIFGKQGGQIKNLLAEIDRNIKAPKDDFAKYLLFEKNSKPKLLAEIEDEKSTSSFLQRQYNQYLELLDRKQQLFSSPLSNILTEKLCWKLLPKGEWNIEDIIKIFRHYKWQEQKFDESRLRKIQKYLKPNICYVGEEDFEGYVVFCFDWTKKVVLECPVFGNAIYIIKGNWKEIARHSKYEALNYYPNHVTRIIHNDTWLSRLHNKLSDIN